MPKEKDLKRIVRTRMQKTGESYTSARRQVLDKKTETSALALVPPPPPPDYAALAGMSDETVQKATGRTWAEWVETLDAWGAKDKPHRAVAEYVSSLGVRDWWSQSVTVGYERIRGLRAIGQRREGSWETSKSRTFAVPVSTLFTAWSNAKQRLKWLPEQLTIRTQTKDRSMRIAMDDGTLLQLWFTPKGEKSSVAVQHTKLPSKEAADRMKVFWGERLDALAQALR